MSPGFGAAGVTSRASTVYRRGHAAMAIPIRMMENPITIQFWTPKIVKSWTSQSPIEALQREVKGARCARPYRPEQIYK